MTRTNGAINQHELKQCLRLSSSFLVTDVTMNTETGMATWYTGFNRLIDVLIALHRRGELELETVSEASKACSECWTAAGSWREMQGCREGVQQIAVRLKSILDENGKTYKGGGIYVP